MPPEQDEALLVLGMHRSGTSALALALARLGWSLGEAQLPAQPGINRDGFGENSQVVEFNERLLAESGYRWYQLASLPLLKDPDGHASASPEGAVSSGEAFESAVAAAQELLAEAFPGARKILLKDPRLCLTLPVWRRALENSGWRSRVILVLRQPASVAASLQRRDGIPLSAGALLWAGYSLAAERGSRGMERAVLRYEDLLSDPTGSLQLFDDLVVDDAAATGIDPSLSHHQACEFPEGSVLPALCGKVMDALVPLDQARSPAARDQLANNLLVELGGRGQLELVNELLESTVSLAGEAVRVGEQHRQALATIAARDADIEQVRRYADTCERAVAEKDREIESANDYASQCEAAVRGKDKEIAEVGAYASQCEATVQEKDREIAEVSAYVAQCEAAVREKDRQIAEVSAYAQQCEATIAARDSELQSRDAQLANRDAQLRALERELEALRGQLAYRILRRLRLLREAAR